MKPFSIRVEQKFSEVGSDSVAAWLRQTLESGSPLAADPGAGEVTLRLSLDENLVQQLCQRESEKPAVALRRLIATRAPSPVSASSSELEPERGEVADVLEPPKPVLPKRMQLEGSDVLPLAKILTFASSRLTDILWKVTPEERRYLDAEMSKDSKLLESEAKLADAVAGILNNRAPRLLVENADVVKGSLIFVAHEGQIFDRRSSRLQEKRHERSAREISAAVSTSAPVSGTSASAEVAAPVMAEDRSGTFFESEESRRQRAELLRRSAEEEMGIFGSGEPI